MSRTQTAAKASTPSPKYVVAYRIDGHIYRATCKDCDRGALVYSSEHGAFLCREHFWQGREKENAR